MSRMDAAPPTRRESARRGLSIVVLGVMAVRVVAGQSAVAAPLFSEAFLEFDSESKPRSVAIADLNGDGNSTWSR